MIGDDAPVDSGHSNGSELGGIRSVLVETEKVRVGEVWLHVCISTPIENSSEEESQPFVDGEVVLIGQVDEDVEGVHKEAVCFAPVLLEDGCDDVPREFTIGSSWAG